MKVFETDDNTIGIFFVIASSLLTTAYIINYKGLDKKTKLVIITGFAIRIAMVLIDVFVTRLPDAGTDDDGFYNASLNLFDNGYKNFSQDAYGGVFSKMLSVAYFFIGSSRFSAQYLNVLLSIVSVLLLAKAMYYYNVSAKPRFIVILLFCLLPNAILVNSILRRETIMEVCICSSILYIAKWHVDKRWKNLFFSILFLIFASLFHTAFIFCALIIIMYFALYNKKKQSVSFSIASINKMLVLFVCAIVAGAGFLSMFNNKLTFVSDMDDIYTVASRAKGGSVYLEGYEINNFGQLILFTPLKLFYFLFSPVPWRFRGPMDVVSFLLDALVYMVLIIKVLKMPKNSMSKLMLTMFVMMSIIFAIGTFNSGTAIRHRFSLLPFLLISYSISKTESQKNTSKIKQNRDNTKLIKNVRSIM